MESRACCEQDQEASASRNWIAPAWVGWGWAVGKIHTLNADELHNSDRVMAVCNGLYSYGMHMCLPRIISLRVIFGYFWPQRILHVEFLVPDSFLQSLSHDMFVKMVYPTGNMVCLVLGSSAAAISAGGHHLCYTGSRVTWKELS